MPVNFQFPSNWPDREEEGILFQNTPLSGGLLFDIALAIQGRDNFRSIEDWNGRIIRNVDDGYFILDFPNIEKRQEQEQLLRKLRDEIKTPREGFQIPRMSGVFEYEGKAYIILGIDDNLKGETNLFAYKWLILDPNKYLEETEWTAKLTKGVRDKTNGLVGPSE